MTTIPDDQLHTYASRVREKVVVITGAANGIGKEAALQFAKHGAKVVIGDVDVKDGERTVASIKKSGGHAVFIKCDVTDWDQQAAMFELAISSFGSVDIVVPNAGVSEIGQFDTVKWSSGKPVKPTMKTLEINLMGVLYTTHLALHYLKLGRANDNEYKSLILIGSMASWSGIPRASLYTASKHAVLGLMRSMYPLFNVEDIRIACIHPWFADTAIVPIPLKVFMAGIPLTPVERIASAIFYAATDPDPETNGSAWLLPDDGPVYRVDREEFKEGVYKMIDQRTKKLFKGVNAVKHSCNVLRDLFRVLGRSVITLVVVTSLAWYGLKNREGLTTMVKHGRHEVNG